MTQNPRISTPHPHHRGHRCEIKTLAGPWVHGPTRPTDSEAREAAAAKLAHLDAQAAQGGAGAVPPAQVPPSDNPAPGTYPDPDPPKQGKGRRGSTPEGIRILGPYPEAGGWKCKLVVGGVLRSAPMDRSKDEALRLAEQLAQTLAQQGVITVAGALDAYLAAKKKAGLRASTLTGLHDGVAAFFLDRLDLQVARLTPRRCQELYDQLQERTSAATHRAYLSRVKSWGRWVASKGWIRSSPVEGIRGVGKRRRGKPQLSWDEGLRLGANCLLEESEGGAAVLMAMLMGLRASEALSRVVRDLDRGGTHLQIDDNQDLAFLLKTESSRRPVLIPTPLRPLLAKLATGKAPTEPLFPGTLGGRRRRQWLNVECRRLCIQAGVPVVCPHSLRGWMTSTAVAAGELPEVVAKGIGHASAEMTLQHYIAPGVAEAAQLARGQAAFAAALPLSLPPTLPS